MHGGASNKCCRGVVFLVQVPVVAFHYSLAAANVDVVAFVVDERDSGVVESRYACLNLMLNFVVIKREKNALTRRLGSKKYQPHSLTMVLVVG